MDSIKSKIIQLRKLANAGRRDLLFGLKHAKLYFILYFVLILVTYNIPLLNRFIEGRLIDELSNSFSTGTYSQKLIVIFSLYVGVFIFIEVLSLAKDYFERMLVMKFDENVRLALANKYSSLDLEYYESSKFNDLLARAQENTSRPRAFAVRICWLLGDFLGFIISIGIILSLSPLILGLILVSNIPKFVSEFKFGNQSWGIWQADAEIYRNSSLIQELLKEEKSLMELKVFRTRSYLYNKLKKLYLSFRNKQKDIEKNRTITKLGLQVFPLIGYGGAYYLLINSVINGSTTIGSFIFYLSAVSKFSSSLSSMLSNTNRLYEYGLFTIDFFKFLDLPIKIKGGEKELMNNRSPKIEFNNVSFKYPNTDKYIFKDFNLTIDPGEHIAIVGENGAGKSTLIKLLQRFYDVNDGEILFDGVNIKELKLDNLYKQLSSLSQTYVKYHFDVKTNIGLGDKDRLDNFPLVQESAGKSGANSFINNYNEGYNQVLSKRFPKGINPSEGQWQKIALARAFFKDAPVLILDEPTSAIDPKAEYEIFDRLFDFAEEKTVIIISHRFSTVRNANRIIVLDEGKVVEQGSHEELMEVNGIYKEAFELQKKGYEDI